jgi:flagellar protein FliL
MTTNATPPTAPDEPAPKKSRRGLFLIAAVALVMLLGGGGAAYWMYAKDAPAEGEAAAKPEEEETEPPAAIELEPFVVNLADPGGSNFLRVNLSLVVKDEEQATLFEENPVTKMKVRSAVLELLALQSADTLITPEGKTTLKKAIAGAASKAAPEMHITDVLFSEFVVQF